MSFSFGLALSLMCGFDFDCWYWFCHDSRNVWETLTGWKAGLVCTEGAGVGDMMGSRCLTRADLKMHCCPWSWTGPIVLLGNLCSFTSHFCKTSRSVSMQMHLGTYQCVHWLPVNKQSLSYDASISGYANAELWRTQMRHFNSRRNHICALTPSIQAYGRFILHASTLWVKAPVLGH